PLREDDAVFGEVTPERSTVDVEPAGRLAPKRTQCRLRDQADESVTIPPEEGRAGGMPVIRPGLLAPSVDRLPAPPARIGGVEWGSAGRVIQVEPPAGEPVPQHGEETGCQSLLRELRSVFTGEEEEHLTAGAQEVVCLAASHGPGVVDGEVQHHLKRELQMGQLPRLPAMRAGSCELGAER